jgi:hypothetical protein
MSLPDLLHDFPHEMSREASLRAIQLLRMTPQARMMAARSSGENNSGNMDERQRMFASLVEAAATVASGGGMSFANGHFPNSNYPVASRQYQGTFNHNRPVFDAQQDVSYQVSQYLQMQANKRLHGHSVHNGQTSTGTLLEVRDYRLPGYSQFQCMQGPGNLSTAMASTRHALYSNSIGVQRFNGEGLWHPDVSAFQPHRSMPPTIGMVNQGDSGAARDSGIATCLPTSLSLPIDNLKVSGHQALLRQQIEAFQATEDDVSTHTRGRNKPIVLGQVGIRCRHCAHLPVLHRQKGSTYFPASTLGIYQAAQNMSTSHIQNGLCSQMPMQLKVQFAQIMALKSTSSGAGRPYWAESAKQLGLVDTETGIFFVRDLPPGARLVDYNKVHGAPSKRADRTN